MKGFGIMLNVGRIKYRPHTMKIGIGEECVWYSSYIKDMEFKYNTDEDCYLIVYFIDGTSQRLDLNPEEVNWDIDHIVIQDYLGTWSVIDQVVYNKEIYFLLEHKEYGDETAYLIVDNYNKVIDDEVYDEWLTHLEEALC